MSADEIIKEQNEKLEKYEKKLRALIQAYKSLLAEKSALEQTVKALGTSDENFFDVDRPSECHQENKAAASSFSSKPGLCVAVITDINQQQQNSAEPHDVVESQNVQTHETSADKNLPDNLVANSVGPRPNFETENSSAKIVTLKKALATITGEKSKQQEAFTEDRKRIIDEKSSLEQKLSDQAYEYRQTKASMEKELNELKRNLIHLKEQRESEMNAHAFMLKEMERKLLDERSNKEKVEQLCKVREFENLAQLGNIEKLEAQICDYELLLKDQETVVSLKNELEKLTTASAFSLDVEHGKVLEAKNEFLAYQEKHEKLVGGLEKKIADLTSLLCDQEQMRRHFTDIVEKLQGQLNRSNTQENGIGAECSVQSIDEKLAECQSLVKRVIFERPDVDVLALFGLKDSKIYKNLHGKCMKDYDLLFNELETLRAASRKLPNQKETPEKRIQVKRLTLAIQEAKNKLEDSQRRYADQELKYKIEVEKLRAELAQNREIFEKTLAAKESDCQRRVADQENQTSKHRERATRLLAEKQQEIDDVRRLSINRSSAAGSTATPRPQPNEGSPSESAYGVLAATRSDSRQSYNSFEEAFGLLTIDPAESPDQHFAPNGSTPSDPLPSANSTSFYYSKELIRKDIEIQKARSELRRLQNQLIAAQHELISKELLQHEIVEKLKDEIRSAESKLARLNENQTFRINKSEGPSNEKNANYNNVEYVKNVFVQFAACNQSTSKLHMLKALCLALKMNFKETEELVKCYAKNSGIKL